MFEKIEVHVNSKRLSELMDSSDEAINYLVYLYRMKKDLSKAVRLFEECNILSNQGLGEVYKEVTSKTPDFLKRIYDFFKVSVRQKYLYRFINEKDYPDFLNSGNSKNDKNISSKERLKLERLGLDSAKIIYASSWKDKAWEFRRKQNPWIIAIYKKEFFTNVEYFLWQINEGIDFKQAAEAYLVIYHK